MSSHHVIHTTAAPNRRPTYYLWVTIALLLAGFVLRVWDLGQPSLWADEVMTEFRAEAPLRDSLESILKTIDQTPFYFLALRLFPTGSNELLLRFPSALMGVIGMAVVMFVFTRLYKRYDMALWGGAWLAFNPYHIWLSRTARGYSLIFVLAVLVSYFFLMLWYRGYSRRTWTLLTLTSMIAYFTHYSMLALPVAQFVLLGMHWRNKSALMRRWFIAQIVAALPMAFWFLLMVINMTAREPQWGPRPLVVDVVLSLRNMTVGYDGYLKWYSLPGLAVALVAIGFTLRYWNKQVVNNLYWVVLLTMPITLVFIVSLFSLNLYVDRYFMVLFPGLVFIVSYGLAYLARHGWPVVLACFALTGGVTVGLSIYHHDIQRENWRDAARYTEAEYQPDDIFVVDRAVTLISFKRYFHVTEPLHVIQLSETDEVIPPSDPEKRYWVIYRSPHEDIHRLSAMKAFDPLESNHTVTSQWLSSRINCVVDYKVFNGVTMLLLNGCQPPVIEPGTAD